MNRVLPLVSIADIELAKTLIASENLRYEEGFDQLVGVFDNTRLIGCGARQGRVLKMLVIQAGHRGEDLLGEIITELINCDMKTRSAGHFIFTKPCAIASFQRLNFKLLVQHPDSGIGLLENRNALHRFLRHTAAGVKPGNNGALVVDADPFSREHRHLIEQAAAEVDQLYVFIPEEGHFMFSPEVRLMLAREGTRDLPNVHLVDAGPYILNDATFPGYFLKQGESREKLRLELDLELFAIRLAPVFHVSTRYVGSDPPDPAMYADSLVMKNWLAKHDIRLVEIPQLLPGSSRMSGRYVRQAISAGEMKKVRELVPGSTYDYLQSLRDHDYRVPIPTLTREDI